MKKRTDDNLYERDRFILELLKAGPRSTRELHNAILEEGFSYDKRSLERRLKILKEKGFGISSKVETPGKKHIWALEEKGFVPDYSEDHHALAVAAAEKYLHIAAPPEKRESLAKVVSDARASLTTRSSLEAKWFSKVRTVNPSHWLEPPTIDSELYKTIRSAMTREEALAIGYKKHNHDKPEKREITPLGIFFRGRVPYLISFNHENDNVSHYPLSRIDYAIESVSLKARIPKSFDIDDYIETKAFFFYGEPFRLKALIHDSVQREIDDAHLGKNQQVSAVPDLDTFKLLEVDILYSLSLIQWLLARAPYLKVLEPAHFREKFEEEVKRAYYNAMADKPHVPKNKNFKA